MTFFKCCTTVAMIHKSNAESDQRQAEWAKRPSTRAGTRKKWGTPHIAVKGSRRTLSALTRLKHDTVGLRFHFLLLHAVVVLICNSSPLVLRHLRMRSFHQTSQRPSSTNYNQKCRARSQPSHCIEGLSKPFVLLQGHTVYHN